MTSIGTSQSADWSSSVQSMVQFRVQSPGFAVSWKLNNSSIRHSIITSNLDSGLMDWTVDYGLES